MAVVRMSVPTEIFHCSVGSCAEIGVRIFNQSMALGLIYRSKNICLL